ncbi:hypothetical protein GQ54DRAFT_298089 [Martensiomyces pterosporus]|nr:hypothetical protein GQ54DRAFT_298089 [Martensiomyces pterosporus]
MGSSASIIGDHPERNGGVGLFGFVALQSSAAVAAAGKCRHTTQHPKGVALYLHWLPQQATGASRPQGSSRPQELAGHKAAAGHRAQAIEPPGQHADSSETSVFFLHSP